MVAESHDRCPACGAGRIITIQSREEIPYFGPIILITVKCTQCEFKYNDVIYLTEKEPTYYSLRVTSAEDLKTRVVRSATAHVRIPELRVEITPGPQAESYVSNVEGILKRVEDATKTLFTLTQDEQQKIRQLKYLEEIRRARGGKTPFTLILKDPRGTSALIPQNDKKIKKRRLAKREIESLMRLKHPMPPPDHRETPSKEPI